MTWLKDMDRPYALGDNEFHLAFATDDFEGAWEMHRKMNCICFENEAMGIYFINDPDESSAINNYYYKSFYKGDTTEREIYNDSSMNIVTVGRNPGYGEWKQSRNHSWDWNTPSGIGDNEKYFNVSV